MSSPASRENRKILIIWLALAAMTFAVFGQTLTHDFVDYDDPVYVYENPMVTRGLTLRGIAWAFSSFFGFNWHPLTWLSHMLDCQLYGLRPGGHHLTSVLVHTATVILLFLVIRRMTGALWRSAFVAALFAIHPLRAESVAWVAERKDVLSGLFFVLTIWAYARHARDLKSQISNLKFNYARVVLLFALGLMCKPMLVTLPLVLLLLDYWPLRRTEPPGKLLTEKLPLLALSAVSCGLTLIAQRDAMQSGESFSLSHRLGNAVMSCLVYLEQMVWPVDLAVFYPYPRHGLPVGQVALALLGVVGLSAVAVWQRRKQPWLLIGWLWYLVMLLPVLGIIQVGGQAHADRYTYLPQIGIYLAIAWWAAELPVSRVALGGLAAGALAMFMFCAWQQTATWQNSETLWTYALACTTDNDVANDNLGLILLKNGKLDQAIAYFEKALEIRPDSPEANDNLGNALLQAGKVDEAIAHGQRAVELQPGDAEAWANLANGLSRQGKLDEAVADFQKALQLNPGMAMGYNNLGAVLMQKGRVDDAISEYEKALQLKPFLAEAHFNLANALVRKGNLAEALAHFEEAARMDPNDAKFLDGLAWFLATSPQDPLRNGPRAIDFAQRANEAAGGTDPAILGTLAAAFAEAGRFDEAQRTARQAISLAQAPGAANLLKRLTTELQLYETGRPFHQP